jgi:hypothetical protein
MRCLRCSSHRTYDQGTYRGPSLAFYGGVGRLAFVPYPTIPRDLIRRAEVENLPLTGLSAIQELRRALGELESAAIMRAREMGASSADIGEALGLTRQAAYYRIRQILARREEEAADSDVVILPETEPTPGT